MAAGALPHPPEATNLRRRLAGPSAGWLPTILLVSLVLSVVYSVNSARWTDNTAVMFPMAILGILSGTWLCGRRVHSAVIVAIGVLGGFALCFIVVAEALPGPTEIVPNFIDLFRDTITWVGNRREGLPAGQQPLVSALENSWSFLTDLGLRLRDWVEILTRLRPSTDNVVFLLWITFAAWGMGFLGAWGLLRRRSVTIAALPAAVVLSINITYLGPVRLPFVVFTIALLLLMVQLNLTTLTERWDRTRTDYSAELGLNITALSLLLVAAVTVFSVFFPRVRANPVSEAFWTYLGDGWSNVEAATNRLFSGVSNPSGLSSLSGPQELGVGDNLPFTRQTTMVVLSTHETYWRGVTFDLFDRSRWENTDSALTLLDAEQDRLVNPETLKAQVTVRALFEIYNSNSSILYTPGEIVSMNRQYQVQSATEGELQDYSVIRGIRRVGHRMTYAVEATSSGATSAQLRLAGLDYPDYLDRYLQAPEMTPRVRELANRFGGITDNPYDLALQIELFLRRFPFSIDVPPLPDDRDAVDFYLFDLRRGFSDYTASAMTMLLRLNDIPARLVAGYAPGYYEEESGAYVVGPEDAHSWVEAYFPGYGWVGFEPSGYRAPVSRPESGSSASGTLELVDEYDLDELADLFGVDLDAFEDDSAGANPLAGVFSRLSGAFIVLGGILAVIFGALLIFILVNYLRAQLESPAAGVRRAYRAMLRYSRWAGYNLDESRTPMEFATRLSAELYPAGSPVGDTGVGPGATSAGVTRPPADIARGYARSTYSDHTLAPADLRVVVRAWKRLRPVLLRRIFRRRRR